MAENLKNLGEFEYSDSIHTGCGRHRQVIIYRGKEIGYLITKEKNPFVPLEEHYMLPDVDYGLQDGWIDFKGWLDDYDGAFAYAVENFERLVYLFENGDYD